MTVTICANLKEIQDYQEVYATGKKCQYLVEYSNNQSREYARAILKEDEILVLDYELAVA
ncbi:hypothetical protein [Microcoleus sp. B4-D4]|uniref:hypothetical protein n=1 Tax=Microcoleus sp. B4-D4 TaxID=2818667 RepID=UPI002FCE88A9